MLPVPGLAEVASLLSAADFAYDDCSPEGRKSSRAAALRAPPEGRGLLELLRRYSELRSAFEGLAEEAGSGSLREIQPGALAAFRGALLGLLRPGVTPLRLWPALVFKAVPLIEKCQTTLFSLEDTQLLQRRLAVIQLSHSRIFLLPPFIQVHSNAQFLLSYFLPHFKPLSPFYRFLHLPVTFALSLCPYDSHTYIHSLTLSLSVFSSRYMHTRIYVYNIYTQTYIYIYI